MLNLENVVVLLHYIANSLGHFPPFGDKICEVCNSI